jgi:type IV secretory pathway VirB10-like protein
MAWMTRRLSLFALLGLLAATYALPAAAQWAWRDDTGRTVYSDRPPPAGIKSEQILRQPGPQSQSYGNNNVGAAPQDGKTDAKDAPKGPKTLAEREMDFRKRMQENAEAEKKQAEEQSRNDQKNAECERMRGYLKALEEGQRVQRTDAQGNREVLDDAQRATEVRRVRDGITRSCN